MAIKIPRNLHVAAILFLAAIMMIGFLIKGLMSGGDKPKQEPAKTEQQAPDQAALIAEIRKQNEAALEAERALRERELAMERTKRELEMKERNLANRQPGTAPSPAQGNQSQGNDKDLERKDAAAISKVIAIRGEQGGLNIPGTDQITGAVSALGAKSTATGSGQRGTDSSFEDRYQSMRDALGQQPKDERGGDERWRDRMANSNGEQSAIMASPARKGTVVHEGTILRAVLMSRINSDLPGMITARVMSNVYETQNGLKLAIPAGSRLIGQYNSDVQQGQRRVMAAFHRIILPDGRSLYLKAANGTDNQGSSGLVGKVDTHFWEMLGSQLLVATVAWAMEPDVGGSSGTNVNVYSGGGSDNGNDLSAHGEILTKAAEKMAKPYENRKPTITLEPGATFNVMVNQDLLLSGGNL
ncbi:MAG: hypothetical protein A2286_03970 [Gammaproteobacteria bacterium RIFOXYA12_FULL_61_12]|nr:MAG: hypothetical protein A2514_14525 [Gammaproteobacteria bacterium RIFOXYD12_FULL_61_37]OGT94455.1 MAG: hypothetical protein A2286_03970 [Gammaproteobacteria bacterium RIFOXYA12_FULL_61_12]